MKEKKESSAKKEKKGKKTVKKSKEIRDSDKGSLFELNLVLQIGQQILKDVMKKVKEDHPNMTLGPYKGVFSKYMKEYSNTFFMEDIKTPGLDDEDKAELLTEAIYIECFCKWLDQEKGITICKKKPKKKRTIKKTH